jgi:predicted nucleotidyltransferase
MIEEIKKRLENQDFLNEIEALRVFGSFARKNFHERMWLEDVSSCLKTATNLYEISDCNSLTAELIERWE